MRVLRRSSVDSTIPTSSLADIAFLLIIFFMVTAVFSATKGLEMQLPREEEEKDRDVTPDPAVYIHVSADRILVDCRVTGPEEILPYLEPRLTNRPDKPVILYVEPDVQYRRMVEVYDLLAGSETAWPFRVNNIHILSQDDVEAYVDLFGIDPLAASCAAD